MQLLMEEWKGENREDCLQQSLSNCAIKNFSNMLILNTLLGLKPGLGGVGGILCSLKLHGTVMP